MERRYGVEDHECTLLHVVSHLALPSYRFIPLLSRKAIECHKIHY